MYKSQRFIYKSWEKIYKCWTEVYKRVKPDISRDN